MTWAWDEARLGLRRIMSSRVGAGVTAGLFESRAKGRLGRSVHWACFGETGAEGRWLQYSLCCYQSHVVIIMFIQIIPQANQIAAGHPRDDLFSATLKSLTVMLL